MPRSPKTSHPIRHLREEILDFEQGEFASFIGVSKSMLGQVENRRREPTPRLIDAIHALTGVARDCLRPGGGPLVTEIGGHPYTRAEYESWSSRLGAPVYEAKCSFFSKQIELRLAALLKSARKGKRFEHVAKEVTSALTKIMKQFNLGPLADDLLAKSLKEAGCPATRWDELVPAGQAVLCHAGGYELCPVDASHFFRRLRETKSDSGFVLLASGKTLTYFDFRTEIDDS